MICVTIPAKKCSVLFVEPQGYCRTQGSFRVTVLSLHASRELDVEDFATIILGKASRDCYLLVANDYFAKQSFDTTTEKSKGKAYTILRLGLTTRIEGSLNSPRCKASNNRILLTAPSGIADLHG